SDTQSLECHVSPPEWCHMAYQLLPVPSPEPPPDHRSTVMVNSGQRWSTVADHREPPPDHHETTARPPINHRSITGQQWLTVSQRSGRVGSTVGTGCHVDHSESATWPWN
ncbi:hypothetical protein Tco_0124410, partial [Tanacetum coccineum]